MTSKIDDLLAQNRKARQAASEFADDEVIERVTKVLATPGFTDALADLSVLQGLITPSDQVHIQVGQIVTVCQANIQQINQRMTAIKAAEVERLKGQPKQA